MTKSEERNLFLKYLATVYRQNPDLEIKKDTIYDELSRFNVDNKGPSRIDKTSLLGVQVALQNRFPYRYFSNGYFWVIENREGMSDKDYRQAMQTSIKMYVAIDLEKLPLVCAKVFEFMIKEHIVMSSKLSMNMRNDALVIRVAKREEALRVMDFLNKLNYKPKVKPNPFTFEANSKVSLAMDGNLSYNSTLAKLMTEYLKYKRAGNRLSDVSEENFRNYVKFVIDDAKENRRPEYKKIYMYNDPSRFNDFIMICELIIHNIDGMTLDDFFRHQGENVTYPLEGPIYTETEQEKVLYVINRLSNYYSVENMHLIIMKYINEEKINYFTRKDGIRSIVQNNFSPKRFKEIISYMGWKALLKASFDTRLKYGDRQLYSALEGLLKDNVLAAFTNERYARSNLDLIIPMPLLIDVIKDKLSSEGLSYDADSLMELVLNEKRMKNGHGRK